MTLAFATILTTHAQETDAKTPQQQPPTTTPTAPDVSSFALVPTGEFTIGDTLDHNKDAKPHKVLVSAFYVQKKEVSIAQWDEIRDWGLMHGYPDLAIGRAKAANHPVHTITWYDTVKWCNARSEKEGLTPCYYTDASQKEVYRKGRKDITNTNVKWSANGYRLPTEAEWEKAARGGLGGKRFPWGDTISHEQANFNNAKNGDLLGSPSFHPTYKVGKEPYTSPVASFASNGYGVYDMSGNIAEWCWDWLGDYPAKLKNDHRGPGPLYHDPFRGDGSWRIIRGGCWLYPDETSACAFRSSGLPASSDFCTGFRIVCCSVTLEGQTKSTGQERTKK